MRTNKELRKTDGALGPRLVPAPAHHNCEIKLGYGGTRFIAWELFIFG